MFMWFLNKPLMGIVRLEPYLVSKLVKRQERWYVKPREVKGHVWSYTTMGWT